MEPEAINCTTMLPIKVTNVGFATPIKTITRFWLVWSEAGSVITSVVLFETVKLPPRESGVVLIVEPDVSVATLKSSGKSSWSEVAAGGVDSERLSAKVRLLREATLLLVLVKLNVPAQRH